VTAGAARFIDEPPTCSWRRGVPVPAPLAFVANLVWAPGDPERRSIPAAEPIRDS
jgi:hypothetical protein